jgi:hypothetical protein
VYRRCPGVQARQVNDPLLRHGAVGKKVRHGYITAVGVTYAEVDQCNASVIPGSDVYRIELNGPVIVL